MLTLLAVAFWSALLLLLHVYCLYPIVLFILGSIIDRSTAEGSFEELPSVSLVVAAYNEEEVIEEKIQNSLELDYPDDKLDIVVFSDASTEATTGSSARTRTRGYDWNESRGESERRSVKTASPNGSTATSSSSRTRTAYTRPTPSDGSSRSSTRTSGASSESFDIRSTAWKPSPPIERSRS